MNSRSRWCAFVVAVVVVLASARARAGDPPPGARGSAPAAGDEPGPSGASADRAAAQLADGSRDSAATVEARRRFQQGVTAASEGRYADALAEFLASYELRPASATLFNIANLHVALGHPVEAVEAFERYLEDEGADIPQSKRDLAREQLAAQRRRLDEISGREGPDGAPGRNQEAGGTLAPSTSATPQGVPASRAPVIAPERRATGAPAEGVAPGTSAVVRDDSAARSGRTRRLLGYPIAGLGVVAAGSGIVIAALGQKKHDDALDQWYAGDHAGARRTESDSMSQKTLGFVLLGAGSAVAATGAILALTAPSGTRARARAARMAPWVTPAGPGIALAGVW